LTSPAVAGEDTARQWATGRVEAFSDAVLAIAITLLVLEIKLPEDAYDHLWRSLVHEWPSYLAYMTSFLTIGGVWMAHHGLFVRLKGVDQTMMQLNVVLLMVVSFLPFPTGVLAGALHASNRAERVAIGVYGATLWASQLLFAALARYAIRHPELHHELTGSGPPPARERDAQRGGLFYALAIAAGVTFIPKVAAVAYLVIATRGIFLDHGRGPRGGP
jgi:TMEM175 potassium channel family protein